MIYCYSCHGTPARWVVLLHYHTRSHCRGKRKAKRDQSIRTTTKGWEKGKREQGRDREVEREMEKRGGYTIDFSNDLCSPFNTCRWKFKNV